MKTVTTIFNQAVSQDGFLNGKLKIYQPLKGFRASIDSVFLAASLERIKSPTKVLEVGGGAGVASCCLAFRAPFVHITGIEVDPFLSQLAAVNHKNNGLAAQFTPLQADIKDLKSLPLFDHVITNPPFGAKGCATPSPTSLKAKSNTESSRNLKEWIVFCLKNLKPKGTLTIIFEAGRLDELIQLLREKTGGIELFPLWPKKKDLQSASWCAPFTQLKHLVFYIPVLCYMIPKDNTPQAPMKYCAKEERWLGHKRWKKSYGCSGY